MADSYDFGDETRPRNEHDFANGNGFSDTDPESFMPGIEQYEEVLNQIKRKKINEKIEKVYQDALKEIRRASLPSFILLILSLFVGVSDIPFLGNVFESLSKFINPQQQVLNAEINPVSLWWFPVLIFLVFVFCAARANMILKREFYNKEVSEASITRIIDRYSGIVDGIGTALPLLGAAILLISIEKGPAVFLGFAVPFEIKSILILAIAKLFDSVFDALALKYQEIQEIIKNVEKAFSWINQSNQPEINNVAPPAPGPIVIESSVTTEQLDKIYDTMKASQELGASIKGLVTELNGIKMPDERVLGELRQTSAELAKTIAFLGKTLEGMKDPGVSKSLDNLVTLLGAQKK